MTTGQPADSIQDARNRIRDLVHTLSRYFVGRERKSYSSANIEQDELIFLMAIAVVAREPMLVLGPPGTAKSDMVIRFSEACGAVRYFEHMLTMFTEPSEILGPVDIQALREEGQYRRVLGGRIADAEVVFLDEIFKGNSAILNTLLTLMNEHKIYQGSDVVYLPEENLLGFFAASNEIPDNAEILPLKDRFPIKVRLDSVPEDQFFELIDVGVQNDLDRRRGVKPWKDCCSMADFLTLRHYLFEIFGTEPRNGNRPFRFSREMDQLFRRIVLTLRNDLKVSISDRQVVKLYRLIATRAYLDRGATPAYVEPADLVMLCYTAERLEDFSPVDRCVRDMIGGG